MNGLEADAEGQHNKRKHPLAKCEECPLYHVGRYVPSAGPDHASLAFVGEAPGSQEARGGIPFTGPSGKLLDTVNSHYGIKREEVFLTNACLCRPPNNDTPPKMAIQACQERLLFELRDRGADTVVALGNTACESLLGQSGVTKLRVGPGRTSDRLPGVRIIPTLHPAAALRQADFFPHIVTDIGKVVTKHASWVEPQYIVADTELDALDLLAQLEERSDPSNGGTGRIVIDIECDVEKDGAAFGHPNQYSMLCVGLAYAKGRVLVLGEGSLGPEVWNRLAQLLRKRKLVNQNFKFDGAGLYPVIGALEAFFDTMIASYCFDERPGIHSLGYQGIEFLGTPDWKHVVEKYTSGGQGYGNIPRDILYKYNAYDCATTWDLMEYWEARFEADAKQGGKLRELHDMLVKAANQLMYVELNGMAIDRVYIRELTVSYLDSIDIIKDELDLVVADTIAVKGRYDKAAGRQINGNSPQQVTKYLADKNIITDSTDEAHLELILTKVDPDSEVAKFCRTLLKQRREVKLYGTYVKGISKRMYGGRVFPTFLLHGTTTGRLACRNPNLQNIPRESRIRREFIPAREGNVFVQTDYSQAELRVLSYLAGDHYFRDIFNAGDLDIFDDLTPILYPKADRGKLGEAGWKELRIRVKAYVYGLAYGREAGSIATEYDIPRAEAVRGMNAFFDVIPEIVTFREETRKSVLAGNDLVTPYGRHRRFMLITKENVRDVMNQALAFLPQSTASDMCLNAFVEVRKDLRGIGYVRNLVHDSILAECAPEHAEQVEEIMNRRMLESAHVIVGDYVKFATDTKVGYNWGQV